MDCYHCNLPMESGTAKFATWGDRKVLAHRSCDRRALLAYADELGLVPDLDIITDEQLIDAIAAEKLSGEWLDRLEKLPTDEDKREAVHRLRLALENPT